MSARIEEWLTRMREMAAPAAAVRITAAERGRDLGWVFDLAASTSIADVAETIDRTCCDSGVARCELRAFTSEGRWLGQLVHNVDPPEQIVPVSAQLALPAGVEDVLGHVLDATRSFAGLSFKAIVKNQEIAVQMVDRLEKRVDVLTRENADLRQRLADRWEVTDKQHTGQLDDDLARDKAMRNGRVAETFVNAIMARFFGTGTPEGQSIEIRMARAFLLSLAPEQCQKIMEILSEDQRVALAELIGYATRDQAATEAGPSAEPPNAHDAAAAAAAVNAEACRKGQVQ